MSLATLLRLVSLSAALTGTLLLNTSVSFAEHHEGGEKATTEAAPGTAPEPTEPRPVSMVSGLIYTELTTGTGASPNPTSKVTVHYTGTFRRGKVFDSSVERGKPASFPLNRVIKCWTEGLQLMKVGGKAKLMCPPGIAYGERGRPPTIPPNATLFFEVELLGIQ